MNLKQIVALLAILFSGIRVNAQYRYEVGALVGGTFYMGDANPSRLFGDVSGLYGALARYNINYRTALKANVFKGTLAGSVDANSPDFPGVINDLTFATSFWEIGLNMEYNFFPYTRENEPKASPISPYIYAGAGVTLANSVAFNIPFGVGVKYLLTPRINVGAELGMRKLFTDNVEDIGELDDPDNVKGSVFINNDYYSTFGFFVTIGISKREWKCKNR